MDGTLVHSAPIYGEVIVAFSNEKGLPYDITKVVAGYARPLELDLGWGLRLEDQPKMLAAMMAYHADQMRNHRKFVPEVYPGLEKIIPELAEKYELSLITANTRILTEGFIAAHGWEKYFERRRTLCCANDRGYKIKPAPDALHCLYQENKALAFENTVVIGDSAADILMAKNAGAKSIAALWGCDPAGYQKVIDTKPDRVVYETAELSKAIGLVFEL